MKVKPAIPGTVIRYPNDPRRRLPDEGDEVPETGPDSLHWNRLLRTQEIVRVADAPTGHEPVAPLTTR